MLIQPTIEVKTLPAFQHDFSAVSGLSYRSIEFQIGSDDPWNRIIGISPQNFFDILTQDLPGTPKIQVSSNDDEQISIELSEERNIYSDSRSIQHSEVQAGGMLVSVKGQGVGKTIFRNYVELGTHLRLNGFIVQAGDDNGGYAWAKAGVPLQEEGEVINHNVLRRLLRERLESVKDYLYPVDYYEALQLIELNSIYDVNAIADLNAIVSDDVYFDSTDSLDLMDVSDEERRLRALFEFCADNQKDITLGRYLLNGASYRGYLSFDDKVAMPRIEKYVGGFKTIEIVFADDPVQEKNKRAALVA